MPASAIRVVIEGPGGAGRPAGAVGAGERVRGRVEVRAEAGWGEAPLTVGFVRVVRGRHGETREAVTGEVVRRGPWEDGATLVPFEVTAPNGAPSCRGRLFDVQWWVEARVLRPEPRPDVVGAAKVQLRPQAKPEAAPGALERPESGRAGAGATLLMGAAPGLALVAAALVMHGGLESAAGRVNALFGLVVLAVGLGLAWLTRRNDFARHRLGAVRAEVTPQAVRPGEAIGVTLGFTARREVTVSRIVARLEAVERLRVGRGELSEETHRIEQVLVANRQLAPGEAFALVDAVKVPKDAPPTVSLPGAGRRWRLRLQIEIPAWPDWVATAPLTVRLPALAEAAPAAGAAARGETGDGGPEAAALETLAERLRAADEAEAARALAELGGARQLRVTVADVEWTSGLDADALAGGGRTLVGLVGGRTRIGLRFPASRAAEVDAMRPGEVFSVVGRPIAFSPLLDRLELEADPREPALRLEL